MSSEVFAIEIPVSVEDNSGPGVDGVVEKLSELEKTIKRIQKATKEGIGKLGFENSLSGSGKTGFEKSLERAQRSAQRFTKTKFQTRIEAVDHASRTISSVSKKASMLMRKPVRVGISVLDKVTSPIRKILRIFKNPLFTAGATIGMSLGIADSVKTYAGFEKTMSTVQAVSGASDSQLKQLTKTAEHLGDTTAYTATEVGEAMTSMAKAGWTAQQTGAGINGVIQLAAASGESISSISDVVTDTMTAFQMSADQADHFSDVMTVAANASTTGVGEMGQSFKYVGSVAGTLGYNIEDVGIALGLMANRSVKGSMAGTSLRRAISNMISPTKSQAAMMDKLGITMTDSYGKSKDLMTVMKDLRTSFGGLTSAQKVSAASTIFGQQAYNGMLAIINASDDAFNSMTKSIYNADGAASKTASKTLDNLSGAYAIMTSAIDGVKRTLGERMAPWLRKAMSWITDQMPAVKDAVNEMMDWVDEKIRGIQNKFSKLTLTDQWKNADFFGKVSIAWDELIAKPFSSWWNSTGMKLSSSVSKGIGKALGSGISGALRYLLGDVDVTGAGENVGSSFLSGFKNGFNLSSVWDALTGWAKNHTVLATAIGTYLGLQVVGGITKKVSSVIGLFKNLAGNFGESSKPISTTTTAMMNVTANVVYVSGMMGGISGGGSSPILLGSGMQELGTGATPLLLGSGEAAAGTAAATTLANGAVLAGTGGKIATTLATVGTTLGSGATTLAGAAIAGGTAIAGGAAAIYSGVKGVKDIVHSVKSVNKDEKKAYQKSAISTFGGMATGAGIGFMVGGPVGALVGGGIGGVVGTIQGNKIKEAYKEEQKAAEDAAKASNVTQEQIDKNMQEHFGNITLTAKELESIASDTVLGKMSEKMDAFTTAAQNADSSFSTFKSNFESMNQMSWKAGLGGSLSSSEISDFKSYADSFVQSAQDYMDNKHYEFNASVSLLIGKHNAKSYTESGDNMYSSMQKKVSNLGDKLSEKMKIYLKDGILTLDEQKEIDNLTNQIEEITGKVEKAEEKASLKAIQTKYGGSGAALNKSTFQSLTNELATQSQSTIGNYDSALKVGLTNVQLEFEEKRINRKEYDKQVKQLTDGYTAKVDKLRVDVEGIELGSVADAWNLDKKDLTTGLENALKSGVDVANWDVKTASRWLNLDGLDSCSKAAVAQEVASIAAAFPDLFAPLVSAGNASSASAAKQTKGKAAQNVKSAFNQAISANGLINVLFHLGSTNERSTKTASDRRVQIVFSHPVSATGSVNVKYTLGSVAYPKFPPGPVNKSVKKILTYARDNNPMFRHATGGILTKPHVGLVAEDGPEAIIPLSSGKSARGIDLWKKAGDALGVFPHANGGIFGNATAVPNPVGVGAASVSINVNNNINVSGNGNASETAEAIKAQMESAADQLCGLIAERLDKVFDNSPVRK